MVRKRKSEEPREFVSAASIALRVFEKFANAIYDEDGSDEDVRRIETEPGLAEKLARLVMEGVQQTVTAAPRLLEFVATVAIPAVSRFVAKDHFQKDISAKAKVKIAWLGDDFKSHFLKKIETDIPAAELKAHRLRERSLDAPIIAELGGNHETTLAYLWELLRKQPNGEKGVLLTNGYANIFYIKDAKGILWAVGAGWDGGGWCVDAGSVGRPSGWSDGRQVFSR